MESRILQSRLMWLFTALWVILWAGSFEGYMTATFSLPYYAMEKGYSENDWYLCEGVRGVFPIYEYSRATKYKMVALAEGAEEKWVSEELSKVPSGEENDLPGPSLEELMLQENQVSLPATPGPTIREEEHFSPRTQQTQVDLKGLEDYETLVSAFYTIDANTSAGSERLNIHKLLDADMTINKDPSVPQILIFHTHSMEGYADENGGGPGAGIMGAGDYLATILRETYGYHVIHHEGRYDVDGRSDAYSNALPEIAKILEENPSIEVVIDLHRDEMPEDKRLVMDVDGRPTARFMFFNGLSRTKKTGDIDYLYNQNLDGNLSFSFQMQLKAAEYYPGLTRKIYLKGYRYNMHLAPKYLLVELGAQNNTMEEALNACGPLAHVLDLVLSGT